MHLANCKMCWSYPRWQRNTRSPSSYAYHPMVPPHLPQNRRKIGLVAALPQAADYFVIFGLDSDAVLNIGQNPVESCWIWRNSLHFAWKNLENLKNLRRNNRILKPDFIKKNSVTVSVTVAEIWPVNRGYGYTRVNRDTPNYRSYRQWEAMVVGRFLSAPRGHFSRTTAGYLVSVGQQGSHFSICSVVCYL